MAIIYRPNVPGCGGVARNIATSAVHVKNSRGLDKVPSTAAKKRFAAKLRRIRWRIYRDIDLKRGNIVKTLKYYKKQVRLFLRDFKKNWSQKNPRFGRRKLPKHPMMFILPKETRRKLRFVPSALPSLTVVSVHLCRRCQPLITLSEPTKLLWTKLKKSTRKISMINPCQLRLKPNITML